MNAIIVDDEKHVREAVRMLVDWERFGITKVSEASDGEQAIGLIGQERPALIFMDMMMPNLSGSELLEWISEHSPRSKTIVISGHDDFKLVRHTLQHGGIDYLLKPIDADQLTDTVRKAVESWHEDDRERRETTSRSIEVNRLKPAYWDKLLSNLVVEPSSMYTERESIRQEFGGLDQGCPCRLVILSLERIDPVLARKFADNRELLYYSLANICNEIVRRDNAGYAFRYWNSDKEILIAFWKIVDVDTLEEKLREIDSGVRQALGAKVHFGIGSAQSFPQGLGESYREAKQAIKTSNLMDEEARIHYGARLPARIASARFGDGADELRLAIRSGNSDQIARSVGKLLAPLREQKQATVEQLEQWWNEYTVFCSEWLRELAKEDEPALEWPDIARPFELPPLGRSGKLDLTGWETELNRAMLAVAGLLAEKQQKENNLVHEIGKYIQANYHRDITLQDIANHLFVGREYISRKFKQETGENVSDCIGRTRNEKAKLLLLNPHLKIAQVAEMVGYQDEKYFSKVFKKLTGMTPNEYRKSQSV
ncbi:response regulator [Cohnella suwonensis]|uniref:Response regulator n=1 Tax=Cohnella suwonensis TaxID=696072 RepID=A0ABW0M2A9_9BACL